MALFFPAITGNWSGNDTRLKKLRVEAQQEKYILSKNGRFLVDDLGYDQFGQCCIIEPEPELHGAASFKLLEPERIKMYQYLNCALCKHMGIGIGKRSHFFP
jgi:hypothetical protein